MCVLVFVNVCTGSKIVKDPEVKNISRKYCGFEFKFSVALYGMTDSHAVGFQTGAVKEIVAIEGMEFKSSTHCTNVLHVFSRLDFIDQNIA